MSVNRGERVVFSSTCEKSSSFVLEPSWSFSESSLEMMLNGWVKICLCHEVHDKPGQRKLNVTQGSVTFMVNREA